MNFGIFKQFVWHVVNHKEFFWSGQHTNITNKQTNKSPNSGNNTFNNKIQGLLFTFKERTKLIPPAAKFYQTIAERKKQTLVVQTYSSCCQTPGQWWKFLFILLKYIDVSGNGISMASLWTLTMLPIWRSLVFSSFYTYKEIKLDKTWPQKSYFDYHLERKRQRTMLNLLLIYYCHHLHHNRQFFSCQM